MEDARNGLPLAGRIEGLWFKVPPNQGVRNDYRNILHEGKALIQDPNIRLAFIHMTVPHPPGLFRDPNAHAPMPSITWATSSLLTRLCSISQRAGEQPGSGRYGLDCFVGSLCGACRVGVEPVGPKPRSARQTAVSSIRVRC